jgi:hypothetical protein
VMNGRFIGPPMVITAKRILKLRAMIDAHELARKGTVFTITP